jgi:2-aminoethylphosphonate dioxygenase
MLRSMRVYSMGAHERGELVDHFHRCGWVAVDALNDATRAALPRWVDEVAAWPADGGEWLQHFEMTDAGPVLCRSENFVPFHHELRRLLCEGPVLDVASALLGEPAVLYKEKVNYKAPGGGGYSPHQDAPAYPMIDMHVSALIAVDDADEGNGCLEVVSAAHADLLEMDERGCIAAPIVERLVWEPAPVRAGETLWFHSRTPHRSGPNHSRRPRRALYPTYNAASEGDLRAEYYAAKRAAFAEAAPSDRARVSLIGDFEGRPV